MPFIKLWAHTEGHSRVVAIIRTDGMEVLEPLPPDIIANIEGQRKHAPSDQAFLDRILIEYAGTYLRASLIKD